MLANVQQRTIQPVITASVAQGSLVHTDEYDIYARLPAWGYRHKTVCHGRGEYARDEDGDGFCEVPVNTMEGVCPCSARGCVRTAASRRRSCRSISASSSSCTTHAGVEKRCSAPSSLPLSGDALHHPGSRQEPKLFQTVRKQTRNGFQLGER